MQIEFETGTEENLQKSIIYYFKRDFRHKTLRENKYPTIFALQQNIPIFISPADKVKIPIIIEGARPDLAVMGIS